MFRANQVQLYQATNVGLVALRQMEISYYNGVFMTVGTEATLIVGFTYGVFTVTIPGDLAHSHDVISAYYIVSAITVFAAIRVIMTTLFLVVYGPGLSLHGPAGSMAKAADTMRQEMTHVMRGFSLMMACFTISTALSFWVVMDLWAAAISTAFFFVGAYNLGRHMRRIYLKLHWEKSKRAEELYEDIRKDDDNPANLIASTINPMTKNAANNSESDASESSHERIDSTAVNYSFSYNTSDRKNADLAPAPAQTTSNRIISALMGTKKEPAPTATNPEETTRATRVTDAGSIGGGKPVATAKGGKKDRPLLETIMEGYLTKKTTSKGAKWSSWDRRFYVLNAGGTLTGYKDRQEYRNTQKSSLKERPLELDDFLIRVEQADNSNKDNEEFEIGSDAAGTDLGSTTSKGGVVQFYIHLVSKDFDEDGRKYIFRCDTEEEHKQWSEAMQDVVPNSVTFGAAAAIGSRNTVVSAVGGASGKSKGPGSVISKGPGSVA